MHELSLPLTTWPAVEQLGKALGVKHAYPTSPAARGEFPLSSHPELLLLSLVVLVTKLYHPFDGIPRHPYSDDDPAALVVDWKVWNRQHVSLPRTPLHPLQASAEAHPRDHWDVKPTDVVSMNDQQLDGYLDWFERTWLPPTSTDDPTENAANDFDRELFRLFPLTKPALHETGEKEVELPKVSRTSLRRILLCSDRAAA